MKKEEVIARYGEDAYARQLEQRRAYYRAHREEEIVRVEKYNEAHPEEVIAKSQEQHRKGGKYYDKHLRDQQTGIPSDKNRIRMKHRTKYKPYKAIIAPDSQLHHEWVPNTSDYRGIALVEADAHMHGVVDVIEILDGVITLLTEEEVKRGKRNKK